MSENQLMTLSTSDRQILPLNNLEDLEKIARIMVNSRFFGNPTKEEAPVAAAQAVVKIMAGAEYGLTPFVAMRSMHIVDGKVVPSYQMIGALIQRSNKYKYEVVEQSDDRCELAWFQREGAKWVPCSPPVKKDGVMVDTNRSIFGRAEVGQAQLNGKTNWQKYRKQMNFSRALTNGANVFCPEIFGGAIYSPDDFDIKVDDQGDPTDKIDLIQAVKSEVQEAPKEVEASASTGTTENAVATEVEVKEVPKPVADSVASKENATTAESAAATASVTSSPDPAPVGTQEQATTDPKTGAGNVADSEKTVASSPADTDASTATVVDAPVTTTPDPKPVDVSTSPSSESTAKQESASSATETKTGDDPTPASASSAKQPSEPEANTGTTTATDAVANARSGRPTAKNAAALLQVAVLHGMSREDANGLLTQYLIDNGVVTQETLATFKDKWTWDHFDALTTLFSDKK